QADRFLDPAGDGVTDRLGVAGLGLGHDDDGLEAATAVDAESDDVAGAYAVNISDRPLHVFREHVAAGDDDHVLDTATQHELAVDEIGLVAGSQPAVVE